MSAEVETSKDEEVKEQKEKKPLRKRIKEYWAVAFKLLELVVCAICTGFIYEPVSKNGLVKSHIHHIGIMYTAYTGYMVINCIFLLSRVIGDKIPYRTVAMFAISGSALFLITGILMSVDRAYLIEHYRYPSDRRDMILMITSAVFSFGRLLILLSGILLIIERTHLTGFHHPNMYRATMMTISIMFSFFNFVIFAMEALLTFLKKEDL